MLYGFGTNCGAVVNTGMNIRVQHIQGIYGLTQKLFSEQSVSVQNKYLVDSFVYFSMIQYLISLLSE